MTSVHQGLCSTRGKSLVKGLTINARDSFSISYCCSMLAGTMILMSMGLNLHLKSWLKLILISVCHSFFVYSDRSVFFYQPWRNNVHIDATLPFRETYDELRGAWKVLALTTALSKPCHKHNETWTGILAWAVIFIFKNDNRLNPILSEQTFFFILQYKFIE